MANASNITNGTNTTTLFDLNQTAASAAVTAMAEDPLGVEGIKLEAFTAARHDRADFQQWESYFTNHLRNFIALSKSPSPAATAAKQAGPVPNTTIDRTNRTQATNATNVAGA
jgi:hypothetical protein